MKRRRGFTLIEIVIAVTVIGVLASVAVVSYQRSKQRQEYRAMRSNVHVLTDAVKSYFYTVQGYCVTANTAQTNSAYGTQIQDDNFCRYLVYLNAGNPQVRVDYFPLGCGTGASTGLFRFNVSGGQISCVGADCMT